MYNGEEINKLGERELGHIWMHMDKIVFHMHVNLDEKKWGVKTGPGITTDNVEELKKEVLTNRKLLSVLNSLYDPMRNLIKAEELIYEWEMRPPDVVVKSVCIFLRYRIANGKMNGQVCI